MKATLNSIKGHRFFETKNKKLGLSLFFNAFGEKGETLDNVKHTLWFTEKGAKFAFKALDNYGYSQSSLDPLESDDADHAILFNIPPLWC